LELGWRQASTTTFGVTITEAYGINKSSRVVGWYEDNADNAQYGFFLDTTGTFTPLAGEASAIGINRSGQIAEYFVDNTGAHGCFYNGKNLAHIDVPFTGGIDTKALGINKSGQIAGLAATRTWAHGFIATP
jgi:hypothetical protein